jgi:hypothetical protein
MMFYCQFDRSSPSDLCLARAQHDNNKREDYKLLT